MIYLRKAEQAVITKQSLDCLIGLHNRENRVKKEAVLRRGKGEKNVLSRVKPRKANSIGYIMRRKGKDVPLQA